MHCKVCPSFCSVGLSAGSGRKPRTEIGNNAQACQAEVFTAPGQGATRLTNGATAATIESASLSAPDAHRKRTLRG